MRIELNKISKKIKNQEILKDISYVFEGGKIYGIMDITEVEKLCFYELYPVLLI